MCTEHSVHRTGDNTKDRLDAVVFKDKSVLDKAIAALKAADPATDTFLDVMTAHGRLKFGGFTMAKLARVCGSDAKAKNLFLAGATRVDPTLLGVYAAAAPAVPLVGTTFQGTVPVLEPGGSISMVTAKWLVSAGSAAGSTSLPPKCPAGRWRRSSNPPPSRAWCGSSGGSERRLRLLHLPLPSRMQQ